MASWLFMIYSQAEEEKINNTWTAAERCFAVSSATVEAVVVLLIADLVEAYTLRVLHTLRLTNIGVCVTEISDIAVIVVPAATDMSGSVTDWSGIGTVEITVVTSLTATVVGAAVSATEEAIVVVFIADLVPAFTEWMIVADLEFTLM